MVTCDASYCWSSAITTSLGVASSQRGASYRGTPGTDDPFSDTRNNGVRNVPFLMTQGHGGASADGMRRADQASCSVAERRHPVAPSDLRLVHGGVGAVQQVLDVVSWLDLGDSDAGGHPVGTAHLGDGGTEPLGEQLA